MSIEKHYKVKYRIEIQRQLKEIQIKKKLQQEKNILISYNNLMFTLFLLLFLFLSSSLCCKKRKKQRWNVFDKQKKYKTTLKGIERNEGKSKMFWKDEEEK